jgi:hypothetical protein
MTALLKQHCTSVQRDECLQGAGVTAARGADTSRCRTVKIVSTEPRVTDAASYMKVRFVDGHRHPITCHVARADLREKQGLHLICQVIFVEPPIDRNRVQSKFFRFHTEAIREQSVAFQQVAQCLRGVTGSVGNFHR